MSSHQRTNNQDQPNDLFFETDGTFRSQPSGARLEGKMSIETDAGRIPNAESRSATGA
jgi:hypothetical protein